MDYVSTSCISQQGILDASLYCSQNFWHWLSTIPIPLLCALQCLEQCFHAEGNGLQLNTLHSNEYKVSRRWTEYFQNKISTQNWSKANILLKRLSIVSCPGSQGLPDSQLHEQPAANGEVLWEENMGAGERERHRRMYSSGKKGWTPFKYLTFLCVLKRSGCIRDTQKQTFFLSCYSYLL